MIKENWQVIENLFFQIIDSGKSLLTSVKLIH